LTSAKRPEIVHADLVARSLDELPDMLVGVAEDRAER